MDLNKTRKVLSILLMSAMLICLVFNAMKIVGHCADDQTVINVDDVVPCYTHLGDDFCIGVPFNIPDSVFYDLINDWGSGTDLVGVLGFFVQDWDATNGDWVRVGMIMYYSNGYDFVYNPSNGIISFSSSRPSNPNTTGFYKIYRDGTWSYTGYSQNGNFSLNLSNVYANYSGGSSPYLLKINQFISYYPIWFNPSFLPDGVVESSFDDTVLFSPYVSGGSSGGHSKGGDITEYTYDPADTPDPADPSAVAGSGGWLSKILDSLNKIKNGIVYGFQNITNNLQSFFNQIFGGIEDQLNQIIDKLGGADLDITDTSLSDTFLSAFQGSKIYAVKTFYDSVYGTLHSLFDTIQAPETLRFEFNMPSFPFGHSVGGSQVYYPYGRTLVMDFGWYENVRSIILPFILAWLYMNMLVILFRSIPGFISGVPSTNVSSYSSVSQLNVDSMVDEFTASETGEHLAKFRHYVKGFGGGR